RLGMLLKLLQEIASDCCVLFPIHPRTRKAMEEFGYSPRGITVVDPVGYLEMNVLLAGAKTVYTDSGGLQKEAYFHRVPCVTLRDETEWIETIECGWNRLWNQEEYAERKEIKEYGDGKSAQKIVEILDQWDIDRQ
ncbi:MAG TPA: UDP-N-acetylglucosamine 2-epimerase (non-hydrolyzing), partial [Gammaproteobacteria bacterium]|nr:UDP-N-acetylglucosamine 2-epimerase (non-hydrolyzing) [Gammaproteobacteria bacterium]